MARQEVPATHFIVGGDKMPVLRNARGRTVRVGSVLLREATPVGRDGHGFLRLRIGHNEVVAYTTEPLEKQSWIRPLVEDSEVRRARALYQGHHAYPMGPYKVGFTSPFGTSERTLPTAKSLNVRRIVKVRMPPTRLGYDGRWHSLGKAAGTTTGMLFAILYHRVPSESSARKGLTDPVQIEQMRKENANVPSVARFLDLPHLQTRLALRDPVPTHIWPIATWRQIRRQEVAPGMTKEMVAWSRGFPWEAGSPPTFLSKNRWTYGASTIDFQNGRVVRSLKSKG